MDVIQTKVHREPWDVDRRLHELGLTRVGLLAVRDVARHESANATAFHCANGAGTFAYQHGTWALRNEFVKDEWSLDRAEGVEAIRNDKLKVRVAFSNVDLACDDNHVPQPRSRKGAGAERVSGTADLFERLPRFAPRPEGDTALFYLMVDEWGATEFSRPIVKGGTFKTPIERLYLSFGDDGDAGLILPNVNDAPDFEPEVARK